MQEKFVFHMPTRVLFEKGLAERLGSFITGDRVLLIADPFLAKTGVAEALGETLTGKAVAYFSDFEPNPSCESVDAAAAVARERQVGCIVGLGGGSALDVAKIVACLTRDPGSIYDYYSGGGRTLSKRATALVCIPTTAGTGSEVTNVGVFTNRNTQIKMPMVSDEFWPDTALLDPALTVTLPPAVTASTGMDAFCHAIEAYWNSAAQPICDMLAMGALKLIFENIYTAYKTPFHMQARGAMLTASLAAGMAFSQTRTTGIHAVSFPLTTEFGASHGTACSVTLPAFIRASVEKEERKMTVLSHALGFETVGALADGVEALMRSMNMPVRLSELGVKEADLAHIAQVGLTAAIIQLTPATMNEQTVTALLRGIL